MRRTNVVHYRVTESEYALLATAARVLGESLSELARTGALRFATLRTIEGPRAEHAAPDFARDR